jgi:protein-S-isoprenylcysteine O-methyltransferase Ste14
LKLLDFQKVIEALTGYIETKVELIKLDAKDEMSVLISKFFVVLLMGLFFTMVWLFFSIAAALAISQWLENSYIGFLIVGAFYALLAAFLYFNRATVLAKITEKQKEYDLLDEITKVKE